MTLADVRLIDANAADVERICCYYGGNCYIEDVKEWLDEQPTIDAVPVVHGRWVHEQRYGDSGGWVWRCSACRRESITCIISAMKYCHACGAKMDGGASDGN